MSDRFPQLWIKAQTEKIIKDLEAYRWFRAKLDDRGCEFEYAIKERAMSDLISRKKLKAIIEPMVGKFEDDGSFWWSRESILRAIDSELVEVDEPKIGRWVKNEHGLNCCSVCRKRPLQICYYDINYDGYKGKDILSNYCPNCGAKMERRADEYTDNRD